MYIGSINYTNLQGLSDTDLLIHFYNKQMILYTSKICLMVPFYIQHTLICCYILRHKMILYTSKICFTLPLNKSVQYSTFNIPIDILLNASN